jgi:hypothetical protein
MTRTLKSLRTPIAVAAASLLLAACSETAASDDTGAAADPDSSGSSGSAGSSGSSDAGPAATSTLPLPDGVHPLQPPDADGDPVPLVAGRYQVLLSDTLALEIDLAEGTLANEDGLYLDSKDGIIKVEAAGDVYGVPSDPCNDQFPLPVGATVDDLVAAVQDAPIYRVSRPQPVEIGGAAGTYLEIRIPAGYDSLPCKSSELGLPGNPSTSNNMPPGYVGGWWVLDVDGQRVVAQQFCGGRCPSGAADRLTTAVEGITFTAAP